MTTNTIFPISQLALVRNVLKTAGKKVSIRYRGPRRAKTSKFCSLGQSVCLKEDATGFAVYFRDVKIPSKYHAGGFYLGRKPAFPL